MPLPFETEWSRESRQLSRGIHGKLPTRMSERPRWRRARLRRHRSPQILDAGLVGLLLRARRAGEEPFPYLGRVRVRSRAGLWVVIGVAAALTALWFTLSR